MGQGRGNLESVSDLTTVPNRSFLFLGTKHALGKTADPLLLDPQRLRAGISVATLLFDLL